ncbi:predicted protein [Aspergillus terreus NIH2624]|uniref:Xylanolytic transcriptional activator regulatory domain-containing protein n=1 Tax=Aspergillus terreus (strain NIH 2624 / FGSC A1156) TaxID=341663 RepID=Q0C9Y5_ASPTN|nr:uncharacterized protein ATEG_09499 [Aspergillus terreus NIH2624]EAU29690.1 predicted protein [Aspergillus terreus NIH2624]
MASHGILSAVKCDRQEVCANCVDAGVECRRNRPKPRSRQKAHSGNSLSPNAGNELYESQGEAPSKKRKIDDGFARSRSAPNETAEWASPSEDSTHRAKQAKVILQNELNFDGFLDKYSVVIEGSNETNIHWPDHISGKTLETMVTRLLQDETDEQSHHQLSVCIYTKAVSHLYRLFKLSRNPTLKRQYLRSKREYETAGLYALQRIDVCSTPSLLLIQSLISGALLMQKLGKMNQSWVLNSYAARLIVSLNYHEVDGFTPDSGMNEEIHSSLWGCYYLDRTLSYLFVRPPSLPELRVPPSQLVHADTTLLYGPLIGIILDLAQVQGELLDLLLNGQRKFAAEVSAKYENIQARMSKIYSDLHSRRSSLPPTVTNEYLSADFCYHAILVDVYRARLKHHPDAETYKECLLSARASLRAFQSLEKDLAYELGLEDPCPYFLTWTVLLYPLSPFFVLFCNVVRESDFEDYTLLKEVTQGLSRITGNSYVSKMLDLLTALQNLCEPLFQTTMDIQQGSQVSETYGTMDGPVYQAVAPDTTNHTSLDCSHPGPPSTEPVIEPSSTGILPPEMYPESSTSTDGLIWQLFNSQFSLGWFDVDYSPLNGH